jgi:small subunit ribosomal protein S17e
MLASPFSVKYKNYLIFQEINMGRIKTKLVKRASREFVKDFGSDCKTDFSSNKNLISEKMDFQSKKIRNLVAGYVTRLAKNKDKTQV